MCIETVQRDCAIVVNPWTIVIIITDLAVYIIQSSFITHYQPIISHKQSRSRLLKSGPASRGFPSSPFPSPPPLSPPLLSPSFPSPQKYAPLLRLRGPGERFSSPSGSGRSPAAKRYLVNFRLKISPLLAKNSKKKFHSRKSAWSGPAGPPTTALIKLHNS